MWLVGHVCPLFSSFYQPGVPWNIRSYICCIFFILLVFMDDTRELTSQSWLLIQAMMGSFGVMQSNVFLLTATSTLSRCWKCWAHCYLTPLQSVINRFLSMTWCLHKTHWQLGCWFADWYCLIVSMNTPICLYPSVFFFSYIVSTLGRAISVVYWAVGNQGTSPSCPLRVGTRKAATTIASLASTDATTQGTYRGCHITRPCIYVYLCSPEHTGVLVSAKAPRYRGKEEDEGALLKQNKVKMYLSFGTGFGLYKADLQAGRK